MRKNKMAGFMAGMLAAALWMTGCSGNGGTETKPAAAAAETETETAGTPAEKKGSQASGEEMEGAALTENKETGKRAILVVSFGTSYNESREATIGAIETAIAEAFPEAETRRAFTSQIIIDHVKKRDDVTIDNVTEALDRAVNNGVKTLVVQPTHLMNGLEYTDLVNEIAENADSFEKVVVGEPLLTSDDDFKAVIQAITDATKEYDDGETAICFMGHGTEADSNQVYAKMQDMLTEEGFEHYYVGTVEATPSLEDVVAKVKEGSYKKVVLEPLMIVAGDHANNDMAGDEEGSWKTTFEEAGYEVTCLVRGLGELEPIQQLFVEHAKAAVDSLAK